MLHLNINSLFYNFNYLKTILDLHVYDIISINESKLDENIPSKLFSHNYYNIIRRYRNRSGGGILIFVRKAYTVLSSLLLLLFNRAIQSGVIPSEWKTKLVIPHFKNKGEKFDSNNYRAISILPPLAKDFEKILSQIKDFFEMTMIFWKHHHGFRKSHSCDSALHSLFSKLYSNLHSKLINLLIFFDFRKAFDLVKPKLLLHKLFNYGFDNDALKLIANYFTDRYQFTKIDEYLSSAVGLELGVPQGSILGPLFFLI